MNGRSVSRRVNVGGAGTIRKVLPVLAALLFIGTAASCHHDDNTVSGPSPLPNMTPTPLPPGARTPTPGGHPTPTPAPAPQMATVNVGQGGNNFVDQQSGTSTTTIHAGSTVNWVWVNGTHSTTSGSCPSGSCQPNGQWDSGIGSGMTFSHTFMQTGTFPYFCSVHGAMMQGMVVVQ